METQRERESEKERERIFQRIKCLEVYLLLLLLSDWYFEGEYSPSDDHVQLSGESESAT